MSLSQSARAAAAGGYTAEDQQRWAAERPKSTARTDFQRDRARVLHSAALRRLGGKTQVVVAGHDDFVRTRLTHSLEVAQVGRELATTLGCDPDVVDTACLAHDLGHPPFGHNGEKALAAVMAGHGGFEGNAQSLRLLTRIEPKVIRPDGSSAGLNLTRASLDAALKYPWGPGERGAKFGYYAEDADVVAWVREGAAAAGAGESGRRCLEAQVMDLADDIAYSVHDVEDAIVGGWLAPSALDSTEVTGRVAELVREWYLPAVEDAEVAAALTRLREQPWFVTDFDGSRASLAALKDMTSELIGRFCWATATATLAWHGHRPLVRYAADLVIPADSEVEIAALKGVAAVFVMTLVDRQQDYEAERALLTGLVTRLADGDGAELETPFADDYRSATTDSGRLRAIVDQVASLTDASAVVWARGYH